MDTEYTRSFYLRILLVSLFIALLRLAPLPYSENTLLAKARQSIEHADWLSASQYLAKAGDITPWRYELNLQAGRYAIAAGDAQAAITYFERPGTINQLTNADRLLLGDAHFKTGDPYMAEAIWKRVNQLGDSPQAFGRLANLYLQRHDYPSAIGALEKLIYLNPSETSLYYQVGTLYAATEPLNALPFLAQAVEVDPSRAALAKDLYEKIRTANLFDDPAYTLMISGRQLANHGDWEMASVAFQHAIDLQPGYADAWAFLGEARQQVNLQKANSSGEAGLSELERSLQLDPNTVLGNIFMGLYWERQQDYSQAQRYLERAITLQPTDPYLYSELGNILSKAGDLPAAETRYEDAIQLAPTDPLFYCLLAEFALEQQIQIRELALPAARQAIDLDPGNARALDVMAQVMFALQDYHSAERFSLKAIQADPGYAQAYLHLGTVYIYLQQPDLARQRLSQAKSAGVNTWIAAQADRLLEYYYP